MPAQPPAIHVIQQPLKGVVRAISREEQGEPSLISSLNVLPYGPQDGFRRLSQRAGVTIFGSTSTVPVQGMLAFGYILPPGTTLPFPSTSIPPFIDFPGVTTLTVTGTTPTFSGNAVPFGPTPVVTSTTGDSSTNVNISTGSPFSLSATMFGQVFAFEDDTTADASATLTDALGHTIISIEIGVQTWFNLGSSSAASIAVTGSFGFGSDIVSTVSTSKIAPLDDFSGFGFAQSVTIQGVPLSTGGYEVTLIGLGGGAGSTSTYTTHTYDFSTGPCVITLNSHSTSAGGGGLAALA